MAVPSDRIALFTSIPPKLVRMVEGLDVGEQYQLRCMHSWGELGFPVTSVNPEPEIELLKAKFPDVNTVAVPGAEHPAISRPLVALNDLLDSALAVGAEVILYVNSDIELAGFTGLRSRLERVTPGHALLGQRMELTTPDSMHGPVCTVGFDVFAIHRNDLNHLRTNVPLFIGAPWWDYHIVSQLLLHTIKCTYIDPASVRHLAHSGGWDLSIWQALGVDFGRALLAQVKDLRKTGTSVNVSSFIRGLQEFSAEVSRKQRPAYKAVVREALGHARGVFGPNDLHRFANVFMELVHNDHSVSDRD
ncbi:MAG: hypothetical protein WAR83_01480 [Flavobacteriales bacterium]